VRAPRSEDDHLAGGRVVAQHHRDRFVGFPGDTAGVDEGDEGAARQVSGMGGAEGQPEHSEGESSRLLAQSQHGAARVADR
jgi:hypothetical protein